MWRVGKTPDTFRLGRGFRCLVAAPDDVHAGLRLGLAAPVYGCDTG